KLLMSRNETPITELQDRFVKRALEKIVKVLNMEADRKMIVTVRSSFHENNLYLRPVYSAPERLSDALREPKNQMPFTMAKGIAFTNLLWSRTNEKDQPEARLDFTGQHEIGDATLSEPANFADRINHFAKFLRKQADTISSIAEQVN